MDKNDKITFFEIMTGMAEIFEREVSKASLEIYWQALRQFNMTEIKRATNYIIATRKYPGLPKPAEFIEYIHPPEDIEAKAELATDNILNLLAAGDYRSFEINDPVLAMAIEHLGGWEYVNRTFPRYADQARDQEFWLKNFKNVYKIFLKNPRPNPQMRIAGQLERDNKSKGYITDETGETVIGLLADGTHGRLMIGTLEGQKYLENKQQKQIEAITGESKRG
jgi:hypothetical protein